MTSAVQICSNALLMLGAQTINALDDSSDRARQCSNLYPLVRDYLLTSHPWNCCRRRVLLNPDGVSPGFGYTYAFTLPADFARMRWISDGPGENDPSLDFVLEDGKILCDTSPLYLRYCYLNQNEATWTPLMVMAATQSMRAVMSYGITQSTSLEQLLEQTLQPYLKLARAVDGQDTPPETLGDYPLLSSRFTPVGDPGF
jgi:hypothetical protein